MSEQPAPYHVGDEQAILVERFDRPGGHRWRIHSFYDGDSIALTETGMRELLDWLLLHAGEFDLGQSTPTGPVKRPPKLW